MAQGVLTLVRSRASDDLGSIGCNLDSHPGIEAFEATLRAVRSRSNVSAVWVAITEDMGDDNWPFSDRVYVITTASAEDVNEWFAPVSADPVIDGFHPPPAIQIEVPSGASAFTVWWD